MKIQVELDLEDVFNGAMCDEVIERRVHQIGKAHDSM